MKIKIKNIPTPLPRTMAVFILSLTSYTAETAVVDPINLADVAENVSANIEHCDEAITSRDFIKTFDCGDELFEQRFNALAGVGMNVGDGGRFSRVPRADLTNWANAIPKRETGPNAEACNTCHLPNAIGGAGDGSGPAGLNVIRNPFHSHSPGDFIQRNTPHLFGMAGLQLLAEEMTDELQKNANTAIRKACRNRRELSHRLNAKGIDFGRIIVRPPCPNPKIIIHAKGVDNDLVIKPFEWKGTDLSVRAFSRDAFNEELGMGPVELVGDNIDGDFDSVVNEISIEDVTAMAVYLAGQPRPTSLIELDNLRLRLLRLGKIGRQVIQELSIPKLNRQERRDIFRGKVIFNHIGCSGCHKPNLKLNNHIFTEPSQNANYRENILPAGQNAVVRGLDPEDPIFFDITRDQPDNIITVGNKIIKRLGSFQKNRSGQAIIRLYGDLKRHDMGPELAENIDEHGIGASVWMTKELWGLGSTAPYLHDGRATTIEEAILLHGGEGNSSREKFRMLSARDQRSLLGFLNNLVLFFPEEEEEE